MDKPSLETVIEEHAGELKKLAGRIPGYFDEKDVHDWRVEFKKLRAFLRMITAVVAGHMPLMTSEIKKIYSLAGDIRGLQLFLTFFNEQPETGTRQFPVYEAMLQHQLFAAKEEFIKRCDIFWFEKELDRWLLMCPEYLSTIIVKQFVQQRVTAMRLIMLAPEPEANLHAYRKHVKDLIYNIRVFTNTWGIPFPVTAWKNERILSSAAEELGNFNDQCSRLSFVEEDYISQLPSEEKNALTELREQWQVKKEVAKAALIAKLECIQLMPAVRQI
jgi:CHAD domain-containing protein